MECHDAGATPPATLAEFTLGSGSTQDFYDVSLVDGYNLQMIVEVNGGSGNCVTTGCVDDLNRWCPTELRVDGGGGCRSACDAFGSPEYCCKGAFGTPETCRPTAYAQWSKHSSVNFMPSTILQAKPKAIVVT
ncbi:Thaumatin [Cynara cardunculus var. scolymus]|uniref:Thaumatin n=1 Tax=Cynara cardunculus var. scolymus TaxID=59895 RepID=A0A103Y5J3_CYNCS|nr:Thaumatin [Cynara cardunculus var. scolymus]